MSNQILNPSGLRLPAILFVASPIAFIAVIVSAALGFSNVGVFEEITPQQMATILVAWSTFNAFGGIAVLLGAGGVVTLANILKGTKARLSAWIALVSGIAVIALCILFIILRVSVTGFSETTLGLNSNYQLSDLAFAGLAGPLSMVATVFACIGLFASELLRRTGLVVGILSTALLVFSVISRFPPFVFAFLWLALGVGLLLRKE